jgi:hypothetical protein
MRKSKFILFFSKAAFIYKELVILLSSINKIILETIFWMILVFASIIGYAIYKNFDIEGLFILILFCLLGFVLIVALFFEKKGD